MRLLIDYDYTLFDTSMMRDSLVAALSTVGVTREEYEQGETTLTKDNHYTIDGHIAILAEQHKEELLMTLVDEVLRDTTTFLYDDAIDFLKRHKEEGFDITILSRGNKGFQREKIFASGIQEYAEEVVVVEGKKADILTEWEGQELVSINDKPVEIDEMQQAWPGLKSIWVNRPQGKDYPLSEPTLAHATVKDLQFNVKDLIS